MLTGGSLLRRQPLSVSGAPMPIRWRPIKIGLLGGSHNESPEDNTISVGRAIVRDTDNEAVATCYVLVGVIARKSAVRVIREGVRIYPPAGRNAVVEILKRAAIEPDEVHEGFECTLKISGCKLELGDIVEAIRILA